MSSFSRFQENNKSRATADAAQNAQFIYKRDLSVVLTDADSNTMTAAVVLKQEQNIAYIYTTEANALTIGDIWSTTDQHFLISEELFFIQHVMFHKYKALICNLAVGDTWGYFIGPEKSFIATTLDTNKVVLHSAQHPILVCGGNPYAINTKIMINGRAFLLQEADTLSTSGITYYSLSATTISKQDVTTEDVSISESAAQTPSVDTLSSGTTTVNYNEVIALTTEDGYFKSSTQLITTITHTSTSVSFSIPFGLSSVTIQTKENGEIISHTYAIGD